jgi:hypothetical protein
MYRKFFIEEYNQYYYLQNNETYKLYLETYMGWFLMGISLTPITTLYSISAGSLIKDEIRV